jgi:hypothetical protein
LLVRNNLDDHFLGLLVCFNEVDDNVVRQREMVEDVAFKHLSKEWNGSKTGHHLRHLAREDVGFDKLPGVDRCILVV